MPFALLAVSRLSDSVFHTHPTEILLICIVDEMSEKCARYRESLISATISFSDNFVHISGNFQFQIVQIAQQFQSNRLLSQCYTFIRTTNITSDDQMN